MTRIRVRRRGDFTKAKRLPLFTGRTITAFFLVITTTSCQEHPAGAPVQSANATAGKSADAVLGYRGPGSRDSRIVQHRVPPASVDESPALIWDGQSAPPLAWSEIAKSAEQVLADANATTDEKRRATYVLARAELEYKRGVTASRIIIDRFVRYLRQAPDDMEAQFYLAIAILRSGARHAAILSKYRSRVHAIIDELAASPRRKDSARRHYLLSYLAEIDGDLKLAQQEIEQAIAIAPDWSGARLARALLHYKQGFSRLVLRDIEFVLIHPSADTVQPMTYLLQFLVLSGRSQFQEAESALRIGQRWFPRNAEIFAMLYSLYSATGRAAAAKSTARKFYEACPTDRRAVFSMTLNCLDRGDMNTAHRLYRTFRKCTTGELDEVEARLTLAVWFEVEQEVTALLKRRPFRDLSAEVQWYIILMYVASSNEACRNPHLAYQYLKQTQVPNVNDTGFWFMEAIRAITYAEVGQRDVAFQIIERTEKCLEQRDEKIRDRLHALRSRLMAKNPVRWYPKKGREQILWWSPVLQLGVRPSDGIQLRR